MSNYTCDICLFGKTYTVITTPEESENLQKTAAFLDERIHKMAKASPSCSPDRLYIMIALNMAHELLSIKTGKTNTLRDIRTKIVDIHHDLDEALKKQPK